MWAALSADGTDATGHFEPACPGVLDTLAQSIGPVPRVLLRDTAPGETPRPIVRPDGNGAGDSIRYRIDGEIARGGMGAVFKGRDPGLGREVALKVLREDYRDDATMIRRFVEEAQIGGQLQHPGVVPIYELGTMADRRPFFSMKLVKGHTLAALLGERMKDEGGRMKKTTDEAGSSFILHPSSFSRYLSIFEAVCQTVAYAHARGVIHRDLKPSNVMVGSFGEVQVMDWGLAKVLPRGGVVDDKSAGKTSTETVIATARSGGADADLSRAGSIMGTPAYMAPEQARGEVNQLDERADVFSLGSILCEVLTGHPAFVGSSSGAIQRKATLGDTAEALARLDSCGADAELIALAKACLAREREDRPRDASAVAERMTFYLASVQERMRKAELTGVEERARRRLTTVVAASLVALSTAGGLGLTYWLQQRQAGAARVALALKEATLLRNQAVEHPEDSARWPAALESLERAEAALAEGGDAEARKEVAALGKQIHAEAEAAERDRVLVAKLIDIRSASADDTGGLKTDAAYAAAFRDAGIDTAKLEPAQAGARIAARPEPVRRALVAALDHWAGRRKHWAEQSTREARDAGDQTWLRLAAVARAADPDPDRDALRAALAVVDKAKRLEQIRPLAEKAGAGSWAPSSLVLLAHTLAGSGDAAAGVRVLRRAAAIHPTDVWVHYTLGNLLQQANPPHPPEAVEAYAAARALRPELGHELAHALDHRGRVEEAEAVFRDLVNRSPGKPRHLECLVELLQGRGLDDQAEAVFKRGVAACREAVRLRPDDFIAHSELGEFLCDHAGEYAAAEHEFRTAIQLRPDEAITYFNLGVALFKQGKLDLAIAEFRRVIRLGHDEATLHGALGEALSGKGKLDEAIAELRTAIRLDPENAAAHHKLGDALKRQGKLDDSVGELQTATRLNAADADAQNCLGKALLDHGKPQDAIAAFRQAIHVKPGFAEAHSHLGNALFRQGKTTEAIAECREAIRLKPDLVDPHTLLGSILCDAKHDDAAAEAEFREVTRLKPEDARAHANLGVALQRQRKSAAAIAAYREAVRLKPDLAQFHRQLGAILCDVEHDYTGAEAEFGAAIRLQPDDAWAHYCLGNSLLHQGKLAEAIVAYRAAIRRKPDVIQAHTNLGEALRASGDVSGAIAVCREGIRRWPDNAEFHSNLAGGLRQQGQYAESLAEYRVGHELGSKRPDWSYPSADWVREAERMAALAPRVPELLKGDDRPRDNTERLTLAQMCYDTKRPGAAVRFWAEALAAEPKLGDDRQAGHRYHAACAAALAGSGQGTEEPKLDDTARSRLRGHALDWLKAERAAWARVLDSGDAKARSDVVQNLWQWQAELDLAGVRDRQAIEKLPTGERHGWEAFWKDVDTLLKGAARLEPAEPKPGGAALARHDADRVAPKSSAPLRESVAPATAKSGDARTLERIHRRAHAVALSAPAEAEPLFRQALEGYRKLEGSDGALTLDLTFDLANLLVQGGRGPEAEPLFRAGVEGARKQFGDENPRTAGVMAIWGLSLVQRSQWAEAEPVLRECLAIREKHQPDEWSTFSTRSLLGGSLLGQKKYSEAEPLVVSGYQGMKEREDKRPPAEKPRLTEAADRVVKLYEAWDRPDKVTEWRAKLAKAKPSAADDGKRP
jgi:serine/threonine-protein kinase